jgi:hypothetical protein
MILTESFFARGAHTLKRTASSLMTDAPKLSSHLNLVKEPSYKGGQSKEKNGPGCL